MARSATTDIGATGTEIVTQALYELGEYGPYDTIPTEELIDCLVPLNWMIKLWQGEPDIETKGLKIWQRTEGSLDLGALTAAISYTIQSSGDLDILSPVAVKKVMFRNSDNQEYELTPMTDNDYQRIPDKTQTGSPKRYYYERTYSGGTLYLDIIPSDITGCYLDILYLRPLFDLDAIGADVDFPQHWYMALYLNLAKLLAPRYGAKLSKLTLENAKYALDKAQLFYPEEIDDDYSGFEPGRD